MGEERNRDEGVEVFRRAKGVHHQAGRRRDPGCGNLPQGGDQLGDLRQLEKEVCRVAADQDEAAEAARRRECPAEEDLRGPVAAPRDAAGRDPPNFEAWSDARTGSQDVQRSGGIDPAGLWGHRI